MFNFVFNFDCLSDFNFYLLSFYYLFYIWRLKIFSVGSFALWKHHKNSGFLMTISMCSPFCFACPQACMCLPLSQSYTPLSVLVPFFYHFRLISNFISLGIMENNKKWLKVRQCRMLYEMVVIFFFYILFLATRVMSDY